MSLREIFGGASWLPLDGEMVRVAEFTIGGLIEFGDWCAAQIGDPLDLPYHDDHTVWWMAVVRASKRWPPDMTDVARPDGVDPAAWYAVGLSLTTAHKDTARLGRWLASEDGEAAAFRVRQAWVGQTRYRLGLAMLD